MKRTKLFSLILATAVLFTVFASIPVFAEEEPGTKNNPWDISTSKGNVTAYIEDGMLYITGTGEPKGFASKDRPWQSMKDSITKAVVSDGITLIPSATFYAFPNLTEVELPDSVTKIDNYAFENCPSLKTLDLPAKLTSIGKLAFNASGIESAIMPDGVTSIGEEAYRNCRSLKKIVLPGKITTIRYLTFAGCTAVEEVHWPRSLRKVEYGVFHEFGSKEIHVYYDGSHEEFRTLDMIRSYNMGWSGNPTYYNDCLDNAYFHYTLRTRDDLLYFLGSIANGESHAKEEFTLNNNISLEGYELTKVWSDANREKPFKGHFNGAGYTISDFRITSESYRGGFFRTLGSGAIIENLSLKNGNLTASGDYSAYGMLVGLTDGDVTVSNCHVIDGSVKGCGNVAGLIGCTKSGTAKITDCSNSASVFASGKDAAGILAHNTSNGSIAITNCKNSGYIYANQSYAGGIGGYLGNNSKDQPHTVTGCENNGEIRCEQGISGGIVAGMCTDSIKHVVADNVNTGKVSAMKNAGGIIGFLEGGGSLKHNRNDGEVTSEAENAGGIVAATEDDSSTFEACVNTAKITAKRRSGGIIGYAGDNDHDKQLIFTECHNSGVITGGTDAGGIAGGICTDNRNHLFTDCDNNANITGSDCVGGICGWMEGGGQFTRLTNTGAVTCSDSEGYVGGIIGRIENDPTTFTDCVNHGSLSGGNHRAGICGYDGKTKKAIGSMFGSGNVLYIAAFSLIVIAALVITFLVFRKKRHSVGGKNKNEQ